MRLYNFTSITTDSIFMDDIICEDDLRNIITSIDIVASTRQKACLQLLNYRKKIDSIDLIQEKNYPGMSNPSVNEYGTIMKKNLIMRSVTLLTG